MKFQTDTCPLCNKTCVLGKVAGMTFFSCPTQATENSHYRVNVGDTREVQHIIIYPYSIDSFLYTDSSRSRVYYSTGLTNGLINWKLLMEVPLIRAELEYKMLERINKLITFL